MSKCLIIILLIIVFIGCQSKENDSKKSDSEINNNKPQKENKKEPEIVDAGQTISIKVPDFAEPEIKNFYTAYSDHLIKCIQAIREKNGAKVIDLFKNPGEQLVARERILAKEVVKDPVEKQKYMQYAAQVYPYIKEMERSVYYQKMYGEKREE